MYISLHASGEVSGQNLSNTNNEQLAALDLELLLPGI
jgi:hypothetical protein